MNDRSFSLDSFLAGIRARNLYVLSLAVHSQGEEIASWQANDTPRQVFSVSKSLASLGIGFALQEGLLSLSDRLCELVPPEHGMAPGSEEIRLGDVLIMATGHRQSDADAAMQKAYEGADWADTFYAMPVVTRPGTHFDYDTLATYMLGCAVQKTSGQTLHQYLMPRLFEPLGMAPGWDTCPAGRTQAGVGLQLTVREMARIGQFLLDEGRVGGRQLLDPGYIREAKQVHIRTDDCHLDKKLGYGYQFWRCAWVDSYRASGMHGQFIIVMEREHAVIAVQSMETQNAQGILSLIWETLAPQL